MTWTIEDERIGKQFLGRSKEYDEAMPFLVRMNNAAKDFYYSCYNDSRLAGVRSYIASKTSEAKKNKKDSEPKPKSKEEIYVDELLISEDMQHGLHPDEEFDPEWF